MVRANPTDLQILRLERSFDTEAKLTSVTLVLENGKSGADLVEKRLRLDPLDFAPQGLPDGVKDNGIGLTGLSIFRSVVPPGTEINITLTGADIFRHLSNHDGRRIYHRFRVFSTPAEGDKHVWRIQLVSNLWQHPRRRTALDFPVTTASQRNVSSLLDVIDDVRGFSLIMGSGWVSRTLSLLTGEDWKARNKFICSLRRQKRSDHSDSWTWIIQPLNPGSGRFSIFDGMVSGDVASFGWALPLSEPAEASDTAAFQIVMGTGGGLQGVDRLNGVSEARGFGPLRPGVALRESSFASEAGNGTLLTFGEATKVNDRIPITLSFDVIHDADTRTLTANLTGTFNSRLESEDTVLLNVNFASEASQKTVRFARRDSEASEWRFEITVPSGAQGLPLAALDNGEAGAEALIPDAGTGTDADKYQFVFEPLDDRVELDGQVHLRSLEYGTILCTDPRLHSLALTADIEILTGFAAGAPISQLDVTPAVGDQPAACDLYFDPLEPYVAFSPEAEAAEEAEPVQDGDEGDADSSEQDDTILGPEIAVPPYLLLAGLEAPRVPYGLLERAGHLSLDRGSIDEEARGLLRLPMEYLRLSLRRPADFLTVDLRFALMDLTVTPEGKGLSLVARSPEKETIAPVGGPEVPAITCWLPPQHLMEQAYFRRVNTGVSPPKPTFKPATPADAEDIAKQFLRLEDGNRDERTDARKKLQERALQAEDGAAFQEWLNAFRALDGFEDLPADQQVYIGLADADPDAAQLAWQLSDEIAYAEARGKLIEHMLRIEGYAKPTPPAPHPEWVATAVGVGTVDEVPITVGTNPDLSVLAVRSELSARLYPGKTTLNAGERAEIQARLGEIKQRLSPTYATFMEQWRLRAVGEAGAETFISVEWATLQTQSAVRKIFEEVLRIVADPKAAIADPFQTRSRARLSGPSRVAFVRQEGEVAPYTLEHLIDVTGREMVVPRRAMMPQQRDENGDIRRLEDDEEHLRLNGLLPPKSGLFSDWMAQVYTAASRAPELFETAIELPALLQLSPAQDARWKTGNTPPKGFLTGKDSIGHPNGIAGQVLWNMSLSNQLPDPLLRAIWSPDFRPETYLARAGRLTPRPGASQAERDNIKRLNQQFDTPARGVTAPWTRPRFERRGSNIADATVATAEERRFRTAMSAYDRDQIVKATGVPGLPIRGGLDPETGELRKDAGSFLPPDGYELLDLATTSSLADDDGAANAVLQQQVSHLIYRQTKLTFKRLTLSGMGGTADINAKFQPYASALTRDLQNLFPANTLQRWRHLSVTLRDIRVELSYKGYLAPFGNRASLVKVTARMVVLGQKGRGPTSTPIQRMFITLGEPEKRRWYDQPDRGRGWPCRSVKILTEVTPDLVDPTFGTSYNDQRQVNTAPSGRLSLGQFGKGVVFWPRTAPYAAADLSFEVQFDGLPETSKMPMLFIDFEAANDRQTMSAIVDHYNELSHGLDTEGWDAENVAPSKRRIDQAAVKRRYAAERVEGDSTYETLFWAVGLEGRSGLGEADTGVTPSGNSTLRMKRAEVLGPRANHDFGPLLAAEDQPPFYPFVQFAGLRLDRIGQLLGERRGQSAIVAFDCSYLNYGLPDIKSEPPSKLETILNVLSDVVFEAGAKGDRIGAIGRPAGRLALLSRREGPVTARSKDQFAAQLPKLAPPNFSAKFGGFPNAPEDDLHILRDKQQEAGLLEGLIPGLTDVQLVQFARDTGDAQKLLREVLQLILGNDDSKILGVFKLTEVINFVVSNLVEHVPLIQEAASFAGSAASEIVVFVRENVLDPLRELIADIKSTFESASVSAAGKTLALAKVYPKLDSALTALLAAIDRLEAEEDIAVAADLVAEIPTAGKQVLDALEDIASDPISPLKLELKRLFVEELEQVSEIEDALRALRDVAQSGAILREIEREGVLFAKEQIEQSTSDLVAEISRVAVFPAIGDEDSLPAKAAVEIVTGLIERLFDQAFQGVDEDMDLVPGAIKRVVENLEQLPNQHLAFLDVIANSPSLKEISDDFEDEIDEIEEAAQPFWVQAVAIYDRVVEVVARLERAEQEIREARDALREELEKEGNEADPDVKQALLQTAERLEADIRREAVRLLDEAIKTYLGVDPAALMKAIRQVEADLETATQTDDFKVAARAVLNILKTIDDLFLRGRFGKAIDEQSAGIEATATDRNRALVTPVLRTYKSVLLFAQGTVRGLQVLPSDKKLALAVREMQQASKELRESLADIALAGTGVSEDAVEAAQEALQELKTLLEGAADEVDEALSYAPAVQLIEDLLDLLQQLASNEVKDAIGEIESGAVFFNRFAAAIGGLLQPAVDGVVAISGAVVRAQVAFTTFGSKVGESVAMIDAVLESDNLTFEQVKTLLEDDIPLVETQQVLRAYPALLKEIAGTLERTEQEYRRRLQTLAGLQINTSDDEAAELLLPLIGGAEAAFAAFAQALWRDLDAFIASWATQANAALGRTAVSIGNDASGALAEALGLLKELSDASEALASRFPFLRPVLAEISATITSLGEVVAEPQLLTRAGQIEVARKAWEEAASIEEKIAALKELRETLGTAPDALVSELREALTGQAEAGFDRIRQVAMAEAIAAISSLEAKAEEFGNAALAGLLEAVQFKGPAEGLLEAYHPVLSARNGVLKTLTDGDGKNPSGIAQDIGGVFQFLGLNPNPTNNPPFDPAWFFIAVSAQESQSVQAVHVAKKLVLENDRLKPKDLLALEHQFISDLATAEDGEARLAALRNIITVIDGRQPPAAELIVRGFLDAIERVLQADISAAVDFRRIRGLLAEQLARMVPTRVTRTLSYDTPIQEFRGIFIPKGGQGTLSIRSKNTIDIAGVVEGVVDGGGSGSIEIEAEASAVMSAFDIKLLGGFDAITLSFSAATMTWKLGGTPKFDIDFVDYKIGKELDFVQELASTLGFSAGGFYIKPKFVPIGIEAGYGLVIPAVNLGGVTFMNIGLAASAVLPFERRKAQFRASLSTRSSPFIIIAGIWGGGGHFSLTSDGRRITGFDASFVFGGGGAVAYGPLQLQGRISVGVFIRKSGSLTEISGDFFAGGSGRIAIFGISASLTVRMGMDGTGAMTGSAVFRFSFSIGFAKIRFAITLFKREGKGFSNSGAEASLLHGSYRVAQNGSGAVVPVRRVASNGAVIRVKTKRQDQDYGVWKSYFSTKRPMGYHDEF